MKRILAAALMLALMPAGMAEKSSVDDLLENFGKTLDSAVEVAKEAADSVGKWANESGVTAWFEEAGKSIAEWSKDSGLNALIDDVQAWVEDNDVTQWSKDMGDKLSKFVEENRPAVEAWLQQAGDEVKAAWDTLINAREHTKEEVKKAAEQIERSLAEKAP